MHPPGSNPVSAIVYFCILVERLKIYIISLVEQFTTYILSLVEQFTIYIFSIRGCERVFFSTGREEHETECKYRPIPCQYQIHGCKAVFSQKVKYVFKCRLFSRFLYFSYTLGSPEIEFTEDKIQFSIRALYFNA